MFVLEGTMIGLLGSIVGCIIGFVLVYFWTARYGFDFSSWTKEWGNMSYRSMLFIGVFNPYSYPIAFIFGCAVSAITSIYPAWVASRLQPTEALRKY